MPDRDVVESQEITISAILTQGEPKDKKVQFTLKYGEKEETKEAQLASPDGKPTEQVATLKWTTPAVPADQEKIELTYTVIHDKKELSPAEKIVIWPAAGKLTAVDALDTTGKTVLKGFAYKVVQKIDGAKDAPMELRANDQGTANFALQPGAAFKLEAVTPFEIKETDDGAGKKPRDLKIKARRVFTPRFDTPTVPDTREIKQYVNQARTDDGTKGIGSRVLIRAMCLEDKDKTKDLIGGPGIFCYVKATFAGFDGKPSKRVESAADKKPRLIAGKELSDIKEDTSIPDLKIYTAKLELKKGGKGEFEVELGLCGGDTCIVELGSTPEFKDNIQAIFINWRKIYYELLVPDVMTTLPDTTIAGKQHKNLPNATTARMNSQCADGYLEWELVAGNKLVIDPPKKPAHELPGSFCGKVAPTVFQLSDNQAKEILSVTPKFAGRTPYARFILCNTNYYARKNSANQGDPVTPLKLAGNTETKEVTLTLPVGNWLPRSDHDKSKIGLKWTAAHVPNPVPAALSFEPYVNDANGGTSKKKIVKVTDTSDNSSTTIEFTSTVGDIGTSLSSGDKTKLKTWLQPKMTDDARRTRRNSIKLVVSGELDNDRQRSRAANVRGELLTQFGTLPNPPKDFHPGLTDAGVARTGNFDPDTFVDMTKSNRGKIVVKIPDNDPDDPGKIVGPDAADTCPISVTATYHYHGSGLGTTYREAWKGDLLVVCDPAGELCTADTIIHELGHLFGHTPVEPADNAFAPGVTKPKTIADAEVDEWKINGTKGHLFQAHGYTGSHCAYGLSDAQKATGDYSVPANVPKGAGTCMMWGGGPSTDAMRYPKCDICPQCLMLMRVRDYSTY